MPDNPPGIIRPPLIFFEGHAANPTNQTIESQKNITFITERIEATPGGIMRHMRDLKYPIKGWPTPEAMWNCNIFKRKLMGLMFTFSHKSGWPMVLAFILNPWKWRWLNNAIKHFNWEAVWVMQTVIFREEIWSPCPKELKKFLYLFLYNLGIDPEQAKQFAKTFAFLVEEDDAYRYRIEDIFSETNKDALLNNPRKEISRLLNIYLQREKGGIEFKFKLVSQVISLGLLLPKIKRAFKKATQEIDITALQLDEGDRYHVLFRDNYDFLGRTFPDRYKEWIAVHDGKPPQPVEYKLT